MKRIDALPAALVAATLLLSACGGGGGGGSAPPVPVPSNTPGGGNGGGNGGGGGTSSDACPSTGASASSITSNVSQSAYRRPVSDDGTLRYVPGLINVTYASDADAAGVDAAAALEGARPVTAAQFASLGMRVRVLSVDPARAAALMARLQRTAGVVHAEQAQYRRLTAAVSVNDPYYNGFGPGAPYYETSSDPGQWDMHVINVGTAWGDYSLAARSRCGARHR